MYSARVFFLQPAGDLLLFLFTPRMVYPVSFKSQCFDQLSSACVMVGILTEKQRTATSCDRYPWSCVSWPSRSTHTSGFWRQGTNQTTSVNLSVSSQDIAEKQDKGSSYSAVGAGVLLDVKASTTASPAQSMRLVVSYSGPSENFQSSELHLGSRGMRTLSERTRSLRHLDWLSDGTFCTEISCCCQAVSGGIESYGNLLVVERKGCVDEVVERQVS